MNNTEIITTPDKAQRDRMYQDLRENGDELERQVVKFSDCEQLFKEAGKPEERIIFYGKNSYYSRPVFRSTWSLAYPRT